MGALTRRETFADRIFDQIVGALIGAVAVAALMSWTVVSELREVKTRLVSVESKVDAITEVRVRQQPARAVSN